MMETIKDLLFAWFMGHLLICLIRFLLDVVPCFGIPFGVLLLGLGGITLGRAFIEFIRSKVKK